MRENIIFYRSFAESAREIPDEDRLAFYDALLAYAFDDEDPEDINGIAKALFIIAKANIDANNRKAEAGKRGGRPKPMVSEEEEIEKPMVSEKTAITKPMVSKKTETAKPMVFEKNEIEKPMVSEEEAKTESTEYCIQNTEYCIQSTEKEEKVQKKKNSRFSKPTLEEVRSFIAENRLSVSAERFYDYYESNGWKVGRNPMKDWKATVRNWAKSAAKDAKPGRVVIKPPDYIRTQEEIEALKIEELPF